MAFRSLKSFFPTADELLAADLPHLGQILLVHLNSYEGQVKQNGRLYQGYLLAMLENRSVGLGPRLPGYDFGAKQPEVTRRVMEAWNWLERQGILIPDPSCKGWHLLSTEGERLLAKHAEFERGKRLGFDPVKSDLKHNEGRRTGDVGSASGGPNLAWECLLDEASKLLSEAPTGPQDGNLSAWWGQAKNVIEHWDASKSDEGKRAEELFFSNLESIGKGASERRRGQHQMVNLLNQAKHDLALRAAPMKADNATLGIEHVGIHPQIHVMGHDLSPLHSHDIRRCVRYIPA